MCDFIRKALNNVSGCFFFILLGFLNSAPSVAADTGCSTPPTPLHIGQNTHCFDEKAGFDRSFYLSLPDDYTPEKSYRLLVVFPGTNTTGEAMKKWIGDGWARNMVGLETSMKGSIIVYPDAKIRDFPEWKKNPTARGWLLGPYGSVAKGEEDINFISELLDLIQANYKIENDKVYATGHSWGGDMAAVVGCFLGDRFKAVAPVAANRPYWFDIDGEAAPNCKDHVAVWTVFGLDDEHFPVPTSQLNPGDFGREQNNFWIHRNSCNESPIPVSDVGQPGETVEYSDCTKNVRFTLYSKQYSGSGKQPGHYPPDYFPAELAKWLNGL
ncbi:hypothetical protein DK265_14310 [Pseudomonas aeruginosa]|uniref:alpha/beta hydrolase family esterase n=2 Tax=Pseudomonas aeruginosa TaxID=287 RepID=UPI000D6FC86D|nr:alpha/beta hydrolase-fold protein [Pseudomonas aeruginosa]ELK4918971.1 hypothetical protein [Pseudomonas aeruginosa]MCP9254302.1 alpha/beta hydrolase-fold protein [Pseudomonas aeruginosa]MCT1239333.1 alpha/beta hydrolase-fold protein [Pseudomonas aeruginosa]MDA3425346.1 hypothetical protein [Pseudomonas aeruginosa]PWU35329.1 hypothetical protein DK265_26295 [Pseudomonas aeruginosa]